jgi:hypothetical protein
MHLTLGVFYGSIDDGCIVHDIALEAVRPSTSHPTLLMEFHLSLLYVGKYLNNYAQKTSGVGVEHIPPGWSTWYTLQGNR